MKYIYLDQNKWILLARGWYKGKGEVFDLVTKLKKKILDGEIIVVISLVNVMETMKRGDKNSRERLWKFMIDLSQGYGISPYMGWITEMEIKKMFLKRIGKEIDVKSRVIGKGISFIVGAKPSIKSKISEELKEEMIKKINSVETMEKIFSSPSTIAFQNKLISNLANETIRFETIRKAERTYKDKDLQYNVTSARYLCDFLTNPIIKVSLELGFPRNFIFKEGMSREKLVSLFQELPATYTYFAINDRRDRDLNKKIEDNDLYDLFGFTMGIAYCDIIFGEKRFVSLSKDQAQLHKIYNKVITSSLSEFNQVIS